jgi:epoxyqueuosine reductase
VSESHRPDIQFLPLSTDPGKIRFFGTLMPALLLLRASPWQLVQHQVAGRTTPRGSVPAFLDSGADDASRVDSTVVFVHRWHTAGFDPLSFARAKTFLSRATRLLRREGYAALPLDPLSPDVNLPNLAAQAGLGSLSPFGLLVHPAFGPRLIITALQTDCPLELTSRYQGSACTDCFSCLEVCPQAPRKTATIELGRCQSCAQCLAVCPVGAG